MRPDTLALVVTCLASLLAACSRASIAPQINGGPTEPDGGGSIPDGGGSTPDGGSSEDERIDVHVDGAFARSVMPLPSGGYLVVYDTPVHLKERWGQPSRHLHWLDAAGRESARRDPTPGRELLDAVVHPSGEVTVLEAATDGYYLVRLAKNGGVGGETHLEDPAIATDPPAMLPIESTSPIEETTHDSGRIAPDGERVFLGTRTGRHSVIAYWLDWNSTGFTTERRTLVVPAHSIAATGLTGGSYDTFGQLEAHYGVFVAVDGKGIGWVGVSHARLESGAMVKAHEKVFGEKLVTDPDVLDAFVSRIARSGERLGTTVVSTANDDQLYALRSADDGVYALGRTEKWNDTGTGFDALVARIDGSGIATIRTLDIDRGDIAFDAHTTDNGDIVVAGASGYAQNPSGASITEESHTFLRILRSDGTTASVVVPDGPRHSEARFAIGHRGGLVVCGMLDGPGTHSADGDATLLRASGFVRWVPAP